MTHWAGSRYACVSKTMMLMNMLLMGGRKWWPKNSRERKEENRSRQGALVLQGEHRLLASGRNSWSWDGFIIFYEHSSIWSDISYKMCLQWEHWLLVSETIQCPHICHTRKSAAFCHIVRVVINVRYVSNGLYDHMLFIEHVWWPGHVVAWEHRELIIC